MTRFMFRLAASQNKTIQELQNALGFFDGVPEEYYWIAFANLEGIAQPWLQTGTIAAAIYNQYAKNKVSPLDFMPVRKRSEKESGNVQRAKFHASLGNLPIVDLRQKN